MVLLAAVFGGELFTAPDFGALSAFGATPNAARETRALPGYLRFALRPSANASKPHAPRPAPNVVA